MSNCLTQKGKGFIEDQDLYLIDHTSIPKHIAIVMDGNRRWAKKHGKPIKVAHQQGVAQIDSILLTAAELGVKALTCYAFSTENWNRPKKEVDILFQLLKLFLLKKSKRLIKEGIRFHTIGDISRFPKHIQNALDKTKKATIDCSRIDLVLALNYGGRDEMRRAIIKMMYAQKSGKLEWEKLSEEIISSYLDTKYWPDPELFIRSSGINRLSNFLIWQSSYSEMVISETLWPDFSSKDFINAIIEYQRRQRRFGV